MKQFLSATTFACILALSPSAYARDDTHPTSSLEATSVPYDVQFVDTMAEHHRGGIKMMQLAVDKTQTAKIKKMAQKGIADQTKEIAELESLHKQVKADAPETVNMNLPGMMPKEKMEKDMAKLEDASGSHFDKHFLQSMIQHHQGAVKMSDDALAKLENTDVKTKAQEMHDKQKSEISDMQNMLKGMK